MLVGYLPGAMRDNPFWACPRASLPLEARNDEVHRLGLWHDALTLRYASTFRRALQRVVILLLVALLASLLTNSKGSSLSCALLSKNTQLFLDVVRYFPLL
jgi:hypothetical protein